MASKCVYCQTEKLWKCVTATERDLYCLHYCNHYRLGSAFTTVFGIESWRIVNTKLLKHFYSNQLSSNSWDIDFVPLPTINIRYKRTFKYSRGYHERRVLIYYIFNKTYISLLFSIQFNLSYYYIYHKISNFTRCTRFISSTWYSPF